MTIDTVRRSPETGPDAHPHDPALTPDRAPSSATRLWRGKVADPPWARPALLGLLTATAALYLWGLGASGWANTFYSAAAQAGSESWKAFFFGSSDAANSITVDKPPLSLWAMALSVRVFGLSSWSILVPEALMGVGSVGLLYATVRRTTRSPGAGLLAGAILATTPVAALMFRFNNPDALLVLLLIGAVAATIRALESPVAARWLAFAGALVGLAFLTKMLQAFLVLPGLGLIYLVAADTTLGRRIKHLLIGFLAMIASAGWWIAIVSLWPAASRPYIGGSQHNSILELTLGYNGLGRITGDETGSVGGQGGWGATGWLRMLNSEIGGQVAWLLPAAILLLVAGLWFTRRAARTDLVRAGLVGWGAWLLVTALTFSFMQGIFHAYYTVALAPAIAAVVAIAVTILWRSRGTYAATLTLGAAVALTSSFAFFLLDRTADYHPWLKWLVVIVGLASALMLGAIRHLPRRLGIAVATAAILASLAAPTAYSVTTAATPHTGSIPSAGPGGSGMGGPGGAMRGMPPGATMGGTFPGGTAPGGTTGTTGGTATGAGGAAGGLLNGSTPSTEITSLLTADANDYTWVAAAIGSNSAAGYQLASQEPVMAIGGFNGSDPSPTLAEFKALVAQGKIHYFLGGSDSGGMSPGGGTSSSITTWVTAHFTSQTVDGVTVYDLSTGAS